MVVKAKIKKTKVVPKKGKKAKSSKFLKVKISKIKKASKTKSLKPRKVLKKTSKSSKKKIIKKITKKPTKRLNIKATKEKISKGGKLLRPRFKSGKKVSKPSKLKKLKKVKKIKLPAKVSRIKTARVPKDTKTGYDAKHIQVLMGLEPVRKRPGMYIGSTGTDGLHHLVWEVIDNSIDEVMAGFCNEIWLVIHQDNKLTVIDNGRGIPIDIHPQTKKPALETVMTTLHAGGKFGAGSYKVSGGLHGVGVSVVNALSEWLKVEVARDGKIYTQEYKRGRPLTKVQPSKPNMQSNIPFPLPKFKTGTKVTFIPDPNVLEVLNFHLGTILDHCRQQAYLTKGVKIRIIDERIGSTNTFYFEGGIKSYVKHLNKNKEALFDSPIYISKQIDSNLIEVAIAYTDTFAENVQTFANNIYTAEGGMHLTGFRSALTRVLNDYSKKTGFLKNGENGLSGEDVREGLTAIVSVKLKNPQFEGQTKQRLGNPEIRIQVENTVTECLGYYLEEHPAESRRILEKGLLAARARLAAKAARETVIRKGVLEGMTLPGKLADCSEKNPERSEIYIVEGDSAGGSAKQGRDRTFQAILPLRGKILNVEKTRLDKMLTSNEIKALIVALGVGIGDQFDISKIRYHRVIIMTDADVDGSHIRTLLLTFFFRYMPEIINSGYLYIAQPPLYRIQKSKESFYAYTEPEKEEILSEFKEKTQEKSNKKKIEGFEIKEVGEEETQGAPEKKIGGIAIQRYKGLGEMNPEQLWQTTMDPKNRVILQVTIEDAARADQIFDTLMGEQVLPRKRFIQTHAKNVKNLDI